MTIASRALRVAAVTALLSACGGDDEPAPAESGYDMLDPSVEHYGKSFEAWAEAFVQWINDTSPPECVNPITDTTGASCAQHQDPNSPVFFLAGNYGGVSIREECVMPADKAIFLPIINSAGDNGGVPEDLQLPDSELRAFVEDNFALVDESTLHLSVDGQDIERLERGAIQSARYTIELEPGMNIYDCLGIEGVEGEINGYLSGYWALLPPLEAGAHTVSFGGFAEAAPQGQPVTIDVTFELTVE
jgi:hypothetical protein